MRRVSLSKSILAAWITSPVTSKWWTLIPKNAYVHKEDGVKGCTIKGIRKKTYYALSKVVSLQKTFFYATVLHITLFISMLNSLPCRFIFFSRREYVRMQEYAPQSKEKAHTLFGNANDCWLKVIWSSGWASCLRVKAPLENIFECCSLRRFRILTKTLWSRSILSSYVNLWCVLIF